MAQLLIKLVDHVHSDDNTDRIGSFKRGMVIAVVADNHLWGKMESKQAWLASGNAPEGWHNKTAIIKLVDISPALISSLSMHETLMENEIPKSVRRREWAIDIDALPSNLRYQLEENGLIELTPTAIDSLIYKVSDNNIKYGLF